MKIITLFLTILISITSSFAQNSPITFEEGEFGSDWTWTVFENDTNPPLDIIDNPDPSGINTSAKVARFTALQSGNPWAGFESFEGNLGSFLWDENNRTVKIMVWKSVISDVGIKFDAGAPPNDWAEAEIKVANTKINEWEELTFDFSNALNPPAEYGGLKRLIIFPDFELSGRSQDNVIYIDNISFDTGGGGGSEEPQTAAPIPTQDADKVISLYSSPYEDVPVDTWRTDWSAAGYEEVNIQGRLTKKYRNLDFVGIETVANQIDATGMTHFRIDVWSADFTFFGIKLVDFGPDGAFGGGDDTEHQVNFEMPATGQWISYDIPLSDFVELQNRANIAQFILVGQPTGANTVFVDNVFFYNDTDVSTREQNLLNQRIEVFPNPVAAGHEVYLSEPVESVMIMDLNGRVLRVQNQHYFNTSGMQPGTYILQINTTDNKIAYKKLIIK